MYTMGVRLMTTITASALRKELFQALATVGEGAVLSVTWKGKEVARLVPAPGRDWRRGMRTRPRLLVPPEQAFAPLADDWDGYQ